VSDGTGLIEQDPWLAPYADALRRRYRDYKKALADIERNAGSLQAFSEGYKYFGFNRGLCEARPGIWYREWAPGAEAMFLTGDFNHWDRTSHPLTRDEYGVWHLFLPDENGQNTLVHEGRVKVVVHSATGMLDRVPAYIRRVLFDPETFAATGQYWEPSADYAWQNPVPKLKHSPRVYEAHVGMATEEERVGTFREFADRLVPRIARSGYNIIQLMAIQEHPYYASFGYQVSNFFAVSSRFGTPEDFKYLIDTAHGHGLVVLLDLVHSHAVKNIHDGLNKFDGTDYQYFHAGPRGEHSAWDSRLFDYGKWEVQRFLLSNVNFWLSEYHLDGFRFDGVTSMMYLNHGLGTDFGGYDDYLICNLDRPAITYLQLANQVAHAVKPSCLTIAEDVSGMVGLARPLDEGGLGFDYRLAMGIPDYWIKILKEKRDEEWTMEEIYRMLTNRRIGEKHIAYAESHDQALVGDKTIAFRLMDADMYWLMSKGTASNITIERGMALHKMIRLITFALGGEGYLNFMGNEFGHPEWIDFPRQGNNYSYQYARRQWSLVSNPTLRYRDLDAFDRELQNLDEKFNLLSKTPTEILQVNEDNNLLVCRRGQVVLAFNFHPTRSCADYRIGVPGTSDYRIILNTDDFWFGGHGLVDVGQIYPLQNQPANHCAHSVQIYLPARSAQILSPICE